MREVSKCGAHLSYDVDEKTLNCSNCASWFEPYDNYISEWLFCPICGEPLKWIDDPNRYEDFYEEQYRAKMRHLHVGDGLNFLTGTLSQLAKEVDDDRKH